MGDNQWLIEFLDNTEIIISMSQLLRMLKINIALIQERLPDTPLIYEIWSKPIKEAILTDSSLLDLFFS